MIYTIPLQVEAKECYQCGCPKEGEEDNCIEPDCDANCLITCECGEINDTTYVSICTNTFCEEEI